MSYEEVALEQYAEEPARDPAATSGRDVLARRKAALASPGGTGNVTALGRPSVLAPTEEAEGHPRPLSVPVDSLALGPRLRRRGTNAGHVRILAEAPDCWPPLLVDGAARVVIDGAHRLEAAKLLGLDSVWAVTFHGTEDEAFLEAIRRNNAHGLPLTLADRQVAAQRVVSRHPDWSDRAIAAVCGLSDKTVARLRTPYPGCPTAESPRSNTREGRDGRRRPVNPAAMHRRIAELIEQQPGASLRAIAASAGASPDTVRNVRARLDNGEDAVPLRLRVSEPAAPATKEPVKVWAADSACASSPDRLEFAAWFDGHQIDGREWCRYVETVPLSRIYEVIDEARRRAVVWNLFAGALADRL